MTGVVRRLACALTLIPLAGVLVACSSTSKASGVSAPPAAASPEQVARVYLRAAVTGNCKLTAELTLRHTWTWCDDPKLLDYQSVQSPDYVPASEAGRNEECVTFEMYTHGSSDGSMPTGWQPWSLCLVKTPAGWRLFDQGQGLASPEAGIAWISAPTPTASRSRRPAGQCPERPGERDAHGAAPKRPHAVQPLDRRITGSLTPLAVPGPGRSPSTHKVRSPPACNEAKSQLIPTGIPLDSSTCHQR
jgi:hypothetical protein